MASRASEQLHRVSQSLRSLEKDSNEYLQALTLKVKLQQEVNEEQARARYADLPDEELHAQYEALTDDASDEAIALRELNELRAKYPDEDTKTIDGQIVRGRFSDPRVMRKEREVEALKEKRWGYQNEVDSRNAKKAREAYLERAVQSGLETAGLVEDQRLAAQHEAALSIEDYEIAQNLKNRMNVPYEERPSLRGVGDQAYKEAKDRIDNSANQIRQVGTLPVDFKVTQEYWNKMRGPVEGEDA